MYSSPHKIGAVLTFVCIMLTFSLLTLILGIGGGTTAQFDTAIEEMPRDVLHVHIRRVAGDAEGYQFPIEELSRLEALVPSAEGIAAEAYSIRYVSEEHHTHKEGARFTFIPISVTPGCVGVTANYFSVRGIKIAQGRSFSSLEEQSGANVAVAAVDPEQLPWIDAPIAVGSLVKDCAGRTFEVIGICNAGEGSGIKGGYLYVPVLYTYDLDSVRNLLERKYASGFYVEKIVIPPGMG